MVDKAKKRLQGLGFFKTVEIKRRPGSAPDRVVLDVEVVEQSTGELSFGAGYSTSEGVIGDVSITERNLLGNGQFLRLRLAGSLERLQIDLSFTEPRFLDLNLAAGFDLFHKITTVSTYQQFSARARPEARCASGFPIAENLWMDELLHSLQQRDLRRAGDGVAGHQGGGRAQYWTSAVGHQPVLRSRATIRRTRPAATSARPASSSPASAATCSTSVPRREGRFYYPDHREDHLRRPRHRRPHRRLGWPGRPPARPVLQGWRDHPRLRHGRASARATLLTGDALGGSTFWATTAEVRFPFPFIPDDLGMSGAVFADAGSLFGAGASAKKLNTQCGRRCRSIPTTGAVLNPGVCLADSSRHPCLGRGQHPLELAARTAAPRLRQGHSQRGLRQGAVLPLRRLDAILGCHDLWRLRRQRCSACHFRAAEWRDAASALGSWWHMEHPGFFERAAPLRLEALAQKVGAQLGPGTDAGCSHPRRAAAGRRRRRPRHLPRQPQYLAQLAATRARPAWLRPPSPRACRRAWRRW